MALLANQIMDARILSSMNGRAELSQFLRVTNQSIISQVNSTQDDSRKNRKYPCPLCGKRFRFNSILSLHMRTHTGEKPFKCPYCDHRAAQKGNLKIHLRTHKQGILGKGRGRIREENRLLHELEERAILRDRQTRNGLSSQLQPSSISQLRKPQLSQTVHSQPLLLTNSVAEGRSQATTSPQATSAPDDPIQPQTSGFRCSFCKGKFRKQQELERHIRILHKPYKCTLCEFAASHEEELIGHVEMAHITADSSSGQKAAMGAGDKRKPVGEFPCEVCGQTFSQAWFLKGHMRKHKDSFEHCCQICGRRFKEPWFLKNHMKVHLNKLASKHHLPSDHDASEKMGHLTQEHQSSLFPQYISNLHGRFVAAERADHQDYNQILATAGVDMKVREMIGRMISSGRGLLTDAESSPVGGLNHLQSPLSSTSVECLQKIISSRETLNSYTGWQIMTSGFPFEQQMFAAKDQQQGTPYPSDRCPDEAKASLSDPDTKALSRTSSPEGVSHHGPTESNAEMADSHSGSTFDASPPSPTASVSGEKAYRCPPSSAAQRASLGFYQDDFPFARWQTSRDLSSPLQPTNSSSSPKAKLAPASREGWSPAAGHYLGLESLGENALLVAKQSNLTDKDAEADGSLSRKSQFEPLDLSVRPESAMSPAALVQMAGIFSNGLSSSITQQLHSYFEAAGELGVKPTYQSDLLAQETREKKKTQHVDGGDGVFEKTEQQLEDENDDAAKWKMLKNDIEPEEVVQSGAEFQGPAEKNMQAFWGRGASDSPISSLENLTPGQADQHQHQAGLLSFLRSQGSLSSTSANAHIASMNGGDGMEKDVTSARKPFQCRYCPYNASQKGNLKTHVLCVHRKPFDNSLYPDRRLRRSHVPQTPSRVPQSIEGDDRASGRDQIGMTSLCGT